MVTHIHTAKTTICAICAQNGPTCCQFGQGAAGYGFPLSGVEMKILSACDRRQEMCFTIRVPNSTQFISRVKNHFPDDLDRIQALYPEHGHHEHLATDERGRCVFLGPTGCLLPGKSRPLYCRLFPFWIIGDRVVFFPFALCLAQNSARSVRKVMKCLKMNNPQILSLYYELRAAWEIDELS